MMPNVNTQVQSAQAERLAAVSSVSGSLKSHLRKYNEPRLFLTYEYPDDRKQRVGRKEPPCLQFGTTR
jgi:hypothetical protein